MMGAEGGIGGTYGAMPEVYLKIYNCFKEGDLETAHKLQYLANDIIGDLCGCHGNMYAVIKEVVRIREGLELGDVRAPLANIADTDAEKISKCVEKIDAVFKNYINR